MTQAAAVLGAGSAAITAEAAGRDEPEAASAPPPAPNQNSQEARRPQRVPRSKAVRLRRVRAASGTSSLAATAGAASPIGEAAAEQPPDTQAELRNWIKDNATLLSNASLLISISALALNLLPETGVLDPYIKALIFGAALLLLIEMHYQWPEDLQLHMFRARALPQNHSWRMTAFAFIMQITTLVFAVWATLTTPIILIPLTALGVVVAFRQWYFRRFRGIAARGFGIVSLIVVVLIAELLMVIVWAMITGETVTIELWTDERPDLTIEN